MHGRVCKRYIFRYLLSMLCNFMKILSHASVKKKTKRFQISHFCWSFSSDFLAVKGLMLLTVLSCHLTPSPPRRYLKTTNKGAKCQILKLFSFFSFQQLKKIFIKMHTIQSRLLWDWKLYCLQARPCIFLPGNITGWGSEGVKTCAD